MKTSFVIIALAQALAVASAPTSSDSGETGAMSVAQDVDHAPMSLLTCMPSDPSSLDTADFPRSLGRAQLHGLLRRLPRFRVPKPLRRSWLLLLLLPLRCLQVLQRRPVRLDWA
ncbi:hypothetical protein B0I35DRAFT_266019 [Stachybotrys elegans]|uniref:Secreted protein n=1 Tax=Stachybotrys elegans TaxID=80388 RepID=A0A8K0SU23_9HYPO|nr:hypothetical protein B0I35DRAFT_266019 [Stachybotrys elegans]